MIITDGEREAASKILVVFFGPQAKDWPINEKVLGLIGQILARDKACSRVLDSLPRSSFATAGSLRSLLREIARKLGSEPSGYATCRTTLGWGWRNDVYMASQGLK